MEIFNLAQSIFLFHVNKTTFVQSEHLDLEKSYLSLVSLVAPHIQILLNLFRNTTLSLQLHGIKVI